MPNEGMLPMGDQEVKESEPARLVLVIEPGVVEVSVHCCGVLFAKVQGPEDAVVQGEELWEELLEKTIEAFVIGGCPTRPEI